MKLYIENANKECFLKSSKFVNGVYAHAELDRLAHGDFLHERKTERFDKRRNHDGTECLAVMPDGTEVPALLFFWHSTQVYIHKWWNGTHRQVVKQPRGLLVSKTDTEAIEYAKQQFSMRAKYL